MQLVGMGHSSELKTQLSLPFTADVIDVATALDWKLTSQLSGPHGRWALANRIARGVASANGLSTAERALVASELLMPEVVGSAELVAKEWGAPLSAAYLRVAELGGPSTAIVRRGWHRLRGGPGLPRSQELLEVLAYGRRRAGVQRVVCGEDVVLVALVGRVVVGVTVWSSQMNRYSCILQRHSRVVGLKIHPRDSCHRPSI